jgi:hypothetical protein
MSIGFLAVPLFALQLGGGDKVFAALATGAVVALAAAFVGALLGFLFGLPRSLRATEPPTVLPNGEINQPNALAAAREAEARERARYAASSNLGDIADWLTKILVGVTLVEADRLIAQAERLVRFSSPGFGGAASSPAFAAGLMAAYLLGGFFLAYIWTVTRFRRAVEQTEADIEHFYDQVATQVGNRLEGQLRGQADDVVDRLRQEVRADLGTIADQLSRNTSQQLEAQSTGVADEVYGQLRKLLAEEQQRADEAVEQSAEELRPAEDEAERTEQELRRAEGEGTNRTADSSQSHQDGGQPSEGRQTRPATETTDDQENARPADEADADQNHSDPGQAT